MGNHCYYLRTEMIKITDLIKDRIDLNNSNENEFLQISSYSYRWNELFIVPYAIKFYDFFKITYTFDFTEYCSIHWIFNFTWKLLYRGLWRQCGKKIACRTKERAVRRSRFSIFLKHRQTVDYFSVTATIFRGNEIALAFRGTARSRSEDQW